MIARNGSYFDPDLALQGHYIITGNTNDNFCNDLLQVGDVRHALHNHLLQQGFDAVFFFDYSNMLYCYDYRSYRILRGLETEESNPSTPPSRNVIAMGGPMRNNLQAFNAARLNRQQNRPAVQPQAEDRLNMGTMLIHAAWAQVTALLHNEKYRCALVLSNINTMQSTFSAEVLQTLQELSSGNTTRSSVVIYIFRGNTMSEILKDQSQYGDNNWNIFVRSILLPMMQSESPADNRVISLCTPNAAEIRNLLNHIRFNDRIGLQVEPTQLEDLARNIAYACARENLPLRRLWTRLDQYAIEHRGETMNLDNYTAITGLPRHTTAVEDLERLIGLENVKTELCKHVSALSIRSAMHDTTASSRFTPPSAHRPVRGHLLNVCLMGNPGTGKSEIAKLLGRMYYEAGLLPQGHTIERSASEIVTENVGGTATRVRDLVQQAMGGVLFIDEAYALMKNAHGREAIDQLVNDMTAYEGQFAVVIAGYPNQIRRLLQINEGLPSRFGTTFTLPDYTPDEMRRILELFVSRDEDHVVFSTELAQQLDTFCQNWATDHDKTWSNAREAAKLASLLKRNAQDRIRRSGVTLEADAPIEITSADIPEKLHRYLKPKAQELADVMREINNMIGLQNVKNYLKKLAAGNLWGEENPAPGRFIFHGPPGTGKTHTARLMGTLLQRLGVLDRDYVHEVPAKDLLRPDPNIDYGIQGAPTPQEILQTAVENARGGIFFIDEAHQLVDDQDGGAILRALVPIIDHPEYRKDTCFILAGYSADMRKLLSEDPGLTRRFPEACRIRFDSYTAEELMHLLKLMAEDRGQIPTEEYLARSRLALSKFLETATFDYGNAGYIRDTYLPESIAARTERLNEKYAGSRTALVDRTVAQNVDPQEKRELTGADLPTRFKKDGGPLGLPIPPVKTAEERFNELVGKQEIREYLELRKHPPSEHLFFDNHVEQGLHFALVGPAGTGRHTVARVMASVWKQLGLLDRDNVEFADGSKFISGYVGQTAGQTAGVIETARGGCLVIENPSSMLPSDSTDHSFGPDALGVIASELANPSNDISIVIIESEEGMERLLRAMPSIKIHLSRIFHLEDFTPDEMLQLLRVKTDTALAFEPEIEELLPDFFLNWVSQRGGLGEASRTWGNGTEVDQLVGELNSRWVKMNGSIDDKRGYPRRKITRDMFPANLQNYLTPARENKDTALKQLMDMTGLDSVKTTIQSLERENRMVRGKTPVPGCYVFVGSPGTGKTTVARLMGGILRATNSLKQGHIIERTAQQLVKNPCEFNDALKLAKDGILFIDEAPQLVRYNTGQQVIQDLLTTLEDPRIASCTCIILAGYRREMEALIASDPGLNSRFGGDDSRIVFDDYTPDELVCIMRDFAEKADKISQIRAHAPLLMDDDFVAISKDLFTRVCNSGDPNFGNARFVRTHLRDCYKLLLARMDNQYPNGEYPETEMRTLTGMDIPERIRKNVEKVQLPALIHGAMLSAQEQERFLDGDYSSRLDYYYRRCVLLDVKSSTGKIGVGSGTIISSDGHILTAAHVVNGMDQVRAKIYCPDMPGTPFRWFDCEIMKPINTVCDMALLKMKGHAFPYLPLRIPTEPIGGAERLLLVGYPLGDMLTGGNKDDLLPTNFAGRIGSQQVKPREGRRVLHCYMDGRALHGNSGCPVISMEDGRMIGVFSGSIAPNQEKNLDELNLFFPISYFWGNFVINTTEEE